MKRSEHRYWVYIVPNATRLLYVGFTGRLGFRIQHKTKSLECITNHWKECRLVYYEGWQAVHRAIAREKQIKRWRREKKIALIESVNPNWHDLTEGGISATKNKTKSVASPLAVAKAPARSR